MTAWVPTNQYTIGYRPQPATKLTTSRTELIHLSLAFAVLTIDFALLRTAFRVVGSFGPPSPIFLVEGLAYGAAAALTGFVAHEMAHKISAQRDGFWAEFRMSPYGLMLSLFTAAIVGVLFAAPGATVIGGMGDERERGRTSLAGPLVNLVEGALFAGAAALGLHLRWAPAVIVSLFLLVFINAWFAAFNLLPFGPLDGQKVWRWSRTVWIAAFLVSLAFAASAFFLALKATGST